MVRHKCPSNSLRSCRVCWRPPQKQVRCIFQKYHVAVPGDKCKRSSVPQPGRRKIRCESSEMPGKVLRYLLAKHQTTALKRPFYLLMVMKLLPSEWVDEAELLLRRCWSTSWGGGQILNVLLFNGERIVVESRNDPRGHVSNECFTKIARPMTYLLAFCTRASSARIFCKVAAHTSLLI